MSIESYIEKRYGVIFSAGNVRLNCPICLYTKSKTLSINKSMNRVKCFHANCDYSSNIIQFVSKVEGVTIKEAISIIGEDENIPLKVEVKKKSPESDWKPINTDSHSIGSNFARAYLLKRFVFFQEIFMYKLGYCVNNGVIQIVFPVMDIDSNIIYHIKRNLDKGYIFPKAKEGYVSKSEVLYGIQFAKGFEEIIMCEGVFDVFAIGLNAVAILGKTLSEIQKSMIKNLNKNITVCLDLDAWKNACKICEELKGRNKISIVKLPDGVKDPGEYKGDIGKYIQENKREYRSTFKYEQLY